MDASYKQTQDPTAENDPTKNPEDKTQAKLILQQSAQSFSPGLTKPGQPTVPRPPAQNPAEPMSVPPVPAGSAVTTFGQGMQEYPGPASHGYGQPPGSGGGAKSPSGPVQRAPAGRPGSPQGGGARQDASSAGGGTLPTVPLFSSPRLPEAPGEGGNFLPQKGEPHKWGSPQISSTRDPEESVFQRVERLMQEGDLAGALEEATRAVADGPFDPLAHLLRARVLCRMERFAEAEASAARAVQLNPRSAPAQEVLAWARLNLGKWEDAVAASSQAILLDPNDAFAYAIRAYAYEELGREDGRLNDMAAAARLSPAAYGPQLKTIQAGGKVWSPAPKTAPAKPPAHWTSRPFRVLGALLLFGFLLPAFAGGYWFLIRPRRLRASSSLK